MMAKGLLTWIPGAQVFFNRDAAHGTESAAYCYGVWIKHLTLLWASGMATVPRAVLELGPGASIGTGVAAVLSGAERYIGIDAVAHARPQTNETVFRELVELFLRRAPRPRAGFPPIDQYLDERLFPSMILDSARLDAALYAKRLEAIEQSVRNLGAGMPDDRLRYQTWDSGPRVDAGSIDLVFSHVVLNHVDDLEVIYAECAQCLRPGGWMSHQVDFSALNTAAEWNGHRAYSELAWKVMTGNRPYFVSRETVTKHLELLDANGFDVVQVIRGKRAGGISRHQLAPRWRGISDDDLATETAFIVSRKR
jgi:SAM-dependent methyltransferase